MSKSAAQKNEGVEDRSPFDRWPDAKLVESCLAGDEQAWGHLVDRFKNLVYAIILKYRAEPEEAADLFQAVWLEAYNDLPNLRQASAFKNWLVSLTAHQCFHWKKQQKRRYSHETDVGEGDNLENLAVEDPTFAEELIRHQLVRDAIRRLSPRCQKLIHLLFFSKPPQAYQAVAKSLGLAVGSIGFIRGRCLEKARKALEEQQT